MEIFAKFKEIDLWHLVYVRRIADITLTALHVPYATATCLIDVYYFATSGISVVLRGLVKKTGTCQEFFKILILFFVSNTRRTQIVQSAVIQSNYM